MKNVLLTAGLICAGVTLLVAQSAPAPAAVQPTVNRAAEAAKYRTWLNQNCVGCHSNRVKQPADDPINLEAASTTDLIANAATWERVLRKLAVRAMPPTYTGSASRIVTARRKSGSASPGRLVACSSPARLLNAVATLG